MADRRVGEQTLGLAQQPHIIASFVLGGPKEGNGGLGQYFDGITDHYMNGETSGEKAERKFMVEAAQKALEKAGLSTDDMDFFVSGDLMNQIISSTFSARDLGLPYLGLFSACATSGQALGLGSVLIDGDYADKVLVATASHYQSVERQYRYPIELNIQRKATNQWTCTGGAAAVLARDGQGPRITHVTFGKVVDYGLTDPNDMGCAMAPAANDTFLRHLEDTGRTPADYDLILTGDLAGMGQKMFRTLVKEAGVTLGGKHQDCGAMMYKPEQNPGAGASGAVCSMAGILGYALKEMAQGRYHRILALPTGSLHSPLTAQQGDSVPGISHGIVIEA